MSGPTAGLGESAANALLPAHRRSRRVRILVFAGLLVGIVVLGLFGLNFLGEQIASTLRGTIEFGTSESGCGVSGRASSFPSGTPIHYAAYLPRRIEAGSVVTIRVTHDGDAASAEHRVDSAGDCLTGPIPGPLPPGHCRFEYLADVEPLASGEFDIEASTAAEGEITAAHSLLAPQTPPCVDVANGGDDLPHEDSALEAQLPDVVAGIHLCKGSFRGDTILGNSTSDPARELIAQFGKAVDDYTMALAIDPQGSLVISVGAMRLRGVEGSAYLKAYVRAQGLQTREATLGGKTVTTVPGPGGTSYFYAHGDTVFYASARNVLTAAAGLAALP